ncbi:MAG: CsgG/HfaB family protein, partial [Porphyromonas pasteri]
MNVLKTLSLVALAGLSGLGYATAQEPQRVIAHPGVNNARPADVRSLKWKVAVGRFSNETQYGKGIFYERDNDPMAKQALDILMTKLNASGKFILLERSDSEKLEAELKAGQGQRIGADYLILGSITEFGRKTTGKDGLFTSEKSQTVEAGVSIRIVDVATGQVIYSEEGKGQAQTTSKSTLGLGGKAGYDATLSDKAISGAIDQLVENIINK